MLASSSEVHENTTVPVESPPPEMEANNVGRSGNGPFVYTPLARDGSGEIAEVEEHVVNVEELLRSRQVAADGMSENHEYGQPDPSLERQASMRQIFTDEVQHVASETYLITRLAFTLLKYLGIGIRWLFQLIRLGLYALFLMPGFIQVGYYYFFSKSIQRSLVYGEHPRNRFDLYLPVGRTPRPAVIFVTGGAWVIGYKAWGALLARQLVERNIIVACIDYRNFPQACISDMVSDVSRGIGHVCQNIVDFGGDPNMIYLAGQSAGAHLGACALLIQAMKEVVAEANEGRNSAELTWKASQMKAYMALSGGYNLTSLTEHFHKRGLYRSMFLRIMEGESSLATYSPESIVRSPSFRDAVPLLPPITLFHGTADYSIPYEASVEFRDTLLLVGATATTVLYANKTHTDLILQDPMRGGKIDMLADILAVVHADDEEEQAEDAGAMMQRRMVPECLLQLARWVSPF